MIDDFIDTPFAGIVKSNTGCALILAGSDSDLPHIEKIAKALTEYAVPYRVRIMSAHKQPDQVMGLVKELNDLGGSLTYIAVAGGTDALSGMVSFHAVNPVVSCPPDGMNASCLTNPPGSSCSYIMRPDNVARHVAQTYAGVNAKFRDRLYAHMIAKVDALTEANEKATSMGR